MLGIFSEVSFINDLYDILQMPVRSMPVSMGMMDMTVFMRVCMLMMMTMFMVLTMRVFVVCVTVLLA